MRSKLAWLFFFIIVLTADCCPLGQAASGELVALNPAKTWVFAVGILKFEDAATTSWDAKNRRDVQIVSLLRSRGVPPDHVVYLRDSEARQANLQRRLEELVARTSPGDFLIFYYTGHGADGYFESYDCRWWGMKAIVDTIERGFRGSDVLVIGDCCNSGSMASAISAAAGAIRYAMLSSSAANEEGHGNWTCSQAILDGLEGYPVVDENRDGFITVREIAEYLRKQIAIYEENHSTFKVSGDFNTQLVMSSTAATPAVEPEPVEVFYNDNWWKGKLLERKGKLGHIRWIQLGYDSPDQDEWIDLKNIRPLKPGSNAE